MSKKRKKQPDRTYRDLSLISYNITEDPLEDKYSKRIPEEIREQVEELQNDINFRPKELVPKLVDYIEKHPNIPLLYNYLSAAYSAIGDLDNLESTVLANLKRHPDYLFAKLNYADVCLQKGEPEKIPGIFDHKFDLKLLYPNRSTFHISELAGFTGIICKYYIAIGDREAAELLFKNLKQIAPKHPATKNIKKVLYPSFVGRLFKK